MSYKRNPYIPLHAQVFLRVAPLFFPLMKRIKVPSPPIMVRLFLHCSRKLVNSSEQTTKLTKKFIIVLNMSVVQSVCGAQEKGRELKSNDD